MSHDELKEGAKPKTSGGNIRRNKNDAIFLPQKNNKII